MTRSPRDLCALAAGLAPAALKAAVAAALEADFPADQERNDMASLVAAWLQSPEGDAPPLPDQALDAIYRHVTARVH